MLASAVDMLSAATPAAASPASASSSSISSSSPSGLWTPSLLPLSSPPRPCSSASRCCRRRRLDRIPAHAERVQCRQGQGELGGACACESACVSLVLPTLPTPCTPPHTALPQVPAWRGFCVWARVARANRIARAMCAMFHRRSVGPRYAHTHARDASGCARVSVRACKCAQRLRTRVHACASPRTPW
jgi:hypothetical protein